MGVEEDVLPDVSLHLDLLGTMDSVHHSESHDPGIDFGGDDFVVAWCGVTNWLSVTGFLFRGPILNLLQDFHVLRGQDNDLKLG